MRKLAWTLAAGAVLASGANAEWLISDYSSITTDTANTNAFYGIQGFGTAPNTTNVTVPVAGSVKFDGVFASSTDATNDGYTANIGMIHPLTPDWAHAKLPMIDSITFDLKADVDPSGGWEMAFGSKRYPAEMAEAGTVLTATFNFMDFTAGTFEKIKVVPLDFNYPLWWCGPTSGSKKACPADLTLAKILDSVQAIQIAPKTNYTKAGMQAGAACQACVGPKTPEITFEIKNLTIWGPDINPPGEMIINPTGAGCTTTGISLDDFTGVQPASGKNPQQNATGGYWYALSDTSSTAPAIAVTSADSAVGSSEATWAIADGILNLTGKLNKMVGTQFRPYSGWVAVGTDFGKNTDLTPRIADLTGLTAIQFDALVPETFPAGSVINFKVQVDGVDDDRTHYVSVPVSQLKSSPTVCVRPTDLAQPSWVTTADAFDVKKISKISWELKIKDQKDPAKSAADVGISLGNIKYFGAAAIPFEDNDVGISSRARKASFSVAFSNGMLSVAGLEGFKSADVVSLKGERVASLNVAAKAQPVSLKNGTYVVVARNAAGQPVSSFFSVLK